MKTKTQNHNSWGCRKDWLEKNPNIQTRREQRSQINDGRCPLKLRGEGERMEHESKQTIGNNKDQSVNRWNRKQ